MTSAVLDWMLANSIPLTRDNYVALNWIDGPPSEYGEEELPPELDDDGGLANDAWPIGPGCPRKAARGL